MGKHLGWMDINGLKAILKAWILMASFGQIYSEMWELKETGRQNLKNLQTGQEENKE